MQMSVLQIMPVFAVYAVVSFAIEVFLKHRNSLGFMFMNPVLPII